MSEAVDKVIKDLEFDNICRDLRMLSIAAPLLAMKDNTAQDIFHAFFEQLIERAIDVDIDPREMVTYGYTSYIDILYTTLATIHTEKDTEIFMRFMFEMSLLRGKKNFERNGEGFKKAVKEANASE